MRIEDIEKNVDLHMKSIEQEVKNRFSAEKENQGSRDLMFLHDTIAKSSDVDLFLIMRNKSLPDGRNLFELINKATNDSSLANETANVCNNTLDKLRDLIQNGEIIKLENIEYLLRNPQRKRSMEKARKKLINIFEKRIRIALKKRKKLVEKAIKKEQAGFVTVAEKVDEFVIQALRLKEDIIERLERLHETVIDESVLQNQMVRKSEDIDAIDSKDMIETIDEYSEVIERKKRLKEDINILNNKMQENIEGAKKILEGIAQEKTQTNVISLEEARKGIIAREAVQKIPSNVMLFAEERKKRELQKTG